MSCLQSMTPTSGTVARSGDPVFDAIVQELAVRNFVLDDQPLTLVVVEHDPFLPRLFLEHLILGTQGFDHVLLLFVDPAGEDGQQQCQGCRMKLMVLRRGIRREVSLPRPVCAAG